MLGLMAAEVTSPKNSCRQGIAKTVERHVLHDMMEPRGG
jgi:hypothetical protein